jgi:type II secretory pathway component PulF
MMLGGIIMAVTVVLPGYAQVFDSSGVALPALTRGLLLVSDFFARYMAVMGLGLSALIIAFVLFLRNKKGRNALAWAQLRFSLFRQGINCKFSQALSLMLGAGQPVSAAMPVCAEVIENVRVKRDMAGISAALASGRSFWASLEDLAYIDPMLAGMARVGEETGRLPQTMEQCQTHLSQVYKQSMGRLSKLVEPLITLVLGILLALVMLAIVLPTFELATVF